MGLPADMMWCAGNPRHDSRWSPVPRGQIHRRWMKRATAVWPRIGNSRGWRWLAPAAISGPLLAYAPAIGSLAGTGRALWRRLPPCKPAAPTEAASLNYQASLFFGQAGLERETAEARAAAFACVREGVHAGVPRNAFERATELLADACRVRRRAAAH